MRKITVSAKELYFLGKYLNAQYIDYSYIAMLPDIQRRYEIHEQEALESLEEKEILEVDFSENVEIDREAAELLKPVLFGDAECVLENEKRYHIHRLGSRITIGETDGNDIAFFEPTQKDLEALLTGDLCIRCSEIKNGYFEFRYSAQQMKEKANRNKAMSILKGEG